MAHAQKIPPLKNVLSSLVFPDSKYAHLDLFHRYIELWYLTILCLFFLKQIKLEIIDFLTLDVKKLQ